MVYVVAEEKTKILHTSAKETCLYHPKSIIKPWWWSQPSPKNYACQIGSSSSRDPKFGMFFSWESPPPQLWVPAAQTFGCPSHARRYRGGLSPFLSLSAVLYKSNEGHRGCAILFHSTWRSWSREINLRTLEKNHQKLHMQNHPTCLHCLSQLLFLFISLT